MRSIYFLGLALALSVTGCATQRQVASMQGHGTKQSFNASFDPTWRAAVDGVQQNGLSIVNIDRGRGYIAARRTIRPHTFGENVGVWVTPTSPAETSVEVVSRQAGPPVAWLKNWEHEILQSVAANLTREYPTAAGSALPETYSTTGSATLPPRAPTTLDDQRRLDQLHREREQINSEIDRLERNGVR